MGRQFCISCGGGALRLENMANRQYQPDAGRYAHVSALVGNGGVLYISLRYLLGGLPAVIELCL